MIITLARKPLSEKNVAENTIKHGTGSINIDASRVSGPAWKWGTQTDIKGGGFGSKRPGDGDVFAKDVESDPLGRWPANLILEHRPGCVCTGQVQVKAKQLTAGNRTVSDQKGWGVGHGGCSYQKGDGAKFATEDGTDWIDQWDCVEDCPVLDLSNQSGIRPSGGGGLSGKTAFGQGSGWNQCKVLTPTPIHRHDDHGTAARFFKQVQDKK